MKVTDAQIIEALEKSRGMIAVAARALGVSRRMIYQRRDKSEAIRTALEDAREITIDTAELSLFRAIQAGESWAVKYFLTCFGRERGYEEKQQLEVTGKNGGPIETRDMSDDELRQRARQLNNRLTPVLLNGNGAKGDG